MARVLLPLPTHDFDVTEVVVPWRALLEAGHEVVFATPEGAPARCDPLLLTGVVFGQLGARPENVALYGDLERHPPFLSPLAYAAVDPVGFDALLLPGGHAPGMRSYLGSAVLQDLVVALWKREVPIGAICHGSLVLARSIDPETGHSVVHQRTMTCLPKWMEWSAFALTFWKLGRYYRTYPAYVQDEVEDAGADVVRGPLHNDYDRPFVVEHDRLVTARWPGYAAAFAQRFVDRLGSAPTS